MAHNKIIAIISFGYDRFFGVENVTYNLIQQITKLDKKNKYLLFVNEHVQGLYSSSDNIKKIIVKKMASTQILKTLWLILFYPLISFIKRINITLVINGSNNFSLSPFTKNIIYIHDLGDLYIKNKYDIKRMLYRKYLALPINKFKGDIFVAISKATKKTIVEKLKKS